MMPELKIYGGELYLLGEAPDGQMRIRGLGPVDEAGELVPDFLRADYERLLDEWRHGFDPRAESEASYRIAKGM